MRGTQILPEEARPLLFAHRGLSAEAPENTMAAFRLARKQGIPGIELDVHLTRDGKLAVIHDHDTGRVAGGRGPAGEALPPGPGAKGRGLPLEASKWKELKDLDVGAWKGGEFRGERIPLLQELLEELGKHCYFDIELKNEGRADYGLEAATAKAIRDAGLASRCVISSFNPVSLARFKAIMPEVKTAIIWSGSDELPPFLRHGEGRWLGRADFLKPAQEKAKPTSSFRWRRLEGYKFLPWTVDAPEEAARLLALGAAGIISNRPHALGLKK